MTLPLAHEKWFIDSSEFPMRWDLTFRFPTIGFVLLVVSAVIVAEIIWHLRGRREIVPGPLRLGADRERLCGFYGLVPAILGIHLAVTLLVSGIGRNLFSPNNHFDTGAGYLIGPLEVACALSFFYGTLVRPAALLLALLWCWGLFLAGPQAMLDNTHILGFAAFFFLAGRGPLALDRLIFPRLEPTPRQMRYAVPALRIGLGIGLTVVAFTEKLANLPMALEFLEHYPVNFARALGMPMSDQTFILCAGSVELLIGLLLTFNIFPRITLLVAWVPFNLTLSHFNWNSTEFIGHLPIYGAAAVLLIWDPHGDHEAMFVRGLREGPLRILSDAPGNPLH